MNTSRRPLGSMPTRAQDIALLSRTASPPSGGGERNVGEVIADSSDDAEDPPLSTLRRPTQPAAEATDTTSDDPLWSSQTTVIIAGGKRTAWQWIVAGLGAIAVGMFVPIAILAIGVPVALATRTLVELAAWVGSGVFN